MGAPALFFIRSRKIKKIIIVLLLWRARTLTRNPKNIVIVLLLARASPPAQMRMRIILIMIIILIWQAKKKARAEKPPSPNSLIFADNSIFELCSPCFPQHAFSFSSFLKIEKESAQIIQYNN